MEDKNNNIQELEQLRNEVSEFKNRLEQQEIVSQQLLKQAMTGHVSWIKKYDIWGSILGLCFLPFVMFVMHQVGCSWAPIIFLVIMMVGEAAFNFWNASTIRNSYLMVDDVLSTRQRLLGFKRREQWQMMIEVPLILVWFVWVCFDVAGNRPGDDLSNVMSVTGLIGGVIGFIVAVIIYFRMIRSLNRAVKQIEEFTSK